jgi:hypothetical protein
MRATPDGWLYLVEFPDGTAHEIPEGLLEPTDGWKSDSSAD